MQVLAEETWDWMLLREDARYFLSVVCGSVGIYERNLELDPQEVEQYQRQGNSFLKELARQVAYQPQNFKARHLAWFDESPGVSAAISSWRLQTPALRQDIQPEIPGSNESLS